MAHSYPAQTRSAPRRSSRACPFAGETLDQVTYETGRGGEPACTGSHRSMAEQPGNQTPNTPGVSETALRESKVDELREQAREEGISGTSDMRKEDLVQAIAGERNTGDASRMEGTDDAGAGPEGGRLRTGDQTSSS